MSKKMLEAKKKPEKCNVCGGNVVRILYGEPTEEAFKLADEKKLVLGGCIILEGDHPVWECVNCGQQYFKS